MTHTALGPGREFDVVRLLERRFGDSAAGIGDDAGVFTAPPGETLLVSTDVSVENVHFRRGWISPGEIAYRAATAALSDLAAMAATPRAMVVALTLPASWRADADVLADGLAAAARTARVPIVGGDLSDGGALTIGVTVIGSATRTLARGGGRPGDALWVTGGLGGARVALRAFEAGVAPSDAARRRFAAPVARIAEAAWLAAHGATSCIDLSDGLGADAAHLAAAGGTRVVIDADRVPCFEGATPDDALAGGEDYELLCTGPHALDAAAFADVFHTTLTRIGAVETGPTGVVLRRGGTAVPLPGGFDHFAR